MKKNIALRALPLVVPLLLLCACRQPVSEWDPFGPVSAWEGAHSRDEPPEPPAPEATPEPVAGMELLRDAMLDLCGDELARLGGGTVTMFADRADFPQMIEDTYGVPAELITDGFVLDDNSGSAFELVVLRMTDEDAVYESWDIFSAYVASLRKELFHPEMTEWSLKEKLTVPGILPEEDFEALNYIMGHNGCGAFDCFSIFSICQDKLKEIWDTCIDIIREQILPAERAQEASQPTPQAVEIAEGVFFVPVSWQDAEGEEDPAHPGRIQYVQPNEEDMSVYDTSAIAAAWSAGDPGGLSEYDRAIYDGAKEVLDGILWEGMSEFGKEAAIYEWVIQNVDYDESQTDVLTETSRDSFTPYGGLVSHKAVCLGYAATFQLLAELAGLECVTVVGAGRGGDHAWNQVRLDGEWYCVDVTWDWSFWNVGMMNGREWRFFNTTSDYMARTGHQWDYDNVPEAVAEDHGRP